MISVGIIKEHIKIWEISTVSPPSPTREDFIHPLVCTTVTVVGVGEVRKRKHRSSVHKSHLECVGPTSEGGV